MRKPSDGMSTMNSAWEPAFGPPASLAWKKTTSALLNEVTCHFVPFRR